LQVAASGRDELVSVVALATGSRRPKAVLHHIRMHAMKPPFVPGGKLDPIFEFNMSQYDAEWHRFRLITRSGVAAVLILLLALFALIWIPPHGWGWHVTPLLVALIFGSATSLMVLGAIQSYFRCPRCKNLFSLSGFLSRPSMRRKCVHCGLRLYE
jgi:hypothetical protein